MLSGLKRTGAVACVMATLVLMAPVAMAERGADILVDGLTQSRIWDRSEPVRSMSH